MSNTTNVAESIAQRCKQARPTGNGFQACCPAHDDDSPSLTITPANDRVLIHCHAGCEPGAIMAKLGSTLVDLFAPFSARSNGHKRIVAVYDYFDAHGALVSQTVRYDPKDFRQRRPDPANHGEWFWNLNGIEPVPYHLPQVLEAVQREETIYVCEGEKDADNLQSLGLTATCNPMGAGKWRKSYSEQLRRAAVAIVSDNDKAGRQHAARVAMALHGIAVSVKVIELPGLPEKGDISDWLQAGGTREQLEALGQGTPPWQPTAASAADRPEIHAGAEDATEPLGEGVYGAGNQPEARAADALPYSDYTNAVAMVRRHGRNLRYCPLWRRWLFWNGKYWQKDVGNVMVMRFSKETVKALARHVEAPEEDIAVRALLKHIKTSLATAKLKAMIESAQSEPGMKVEPEDFDKDPWLLNCTNGTVDLRTGTLQPHRRRDLLTRGLSVNYDPAALCPTWQTFLSRIMGTSQGAEHPDMDTGELENRRQADDCAKTLIGFLRRAIGYSLTGDTSEQGLFVLHGTGANGKSTFLEALQALLEDYAQGTHSSTLLIKDRHDGIPNDVARLRGARLVTAVEIGQGKRLDEELVKRLTGIDTLTARFLYAEYRYPPMHRVGYKLRRARARPGGASCAFGDVPE